MTYLAKPKLLRPDTPKNALGYTKRDYEGAISTLCAGCGHDSISAAVVQACFDLDIQPHRVAKLSGIGCSSKTPDYFLGNSHGFNTTHGRMPSVLSGAAVANRDLIYLGVSGDGDSASIGIGQFAHAMRRGVNMTYLVENNGVYGLTKGQFSATADKGSKSKRGLVNNETPIDLVALAEEEEVEQVAVPRSEHVAVPVDPDVPVSGLEDRGDALAVLGFELLDRLAHGLVGGGPPQARVVLVEALGGVEHGDLAAALGHHLAVGLDDDRLGRGGRGVDGDDERVVGHVCSLSVRR